MEVMPTDSGIEIRLETKHEALAIRTASVIYHKTMRADSEYELNVEFLDLAVRASKEAVRLEAEPESEPMILSVRETKLCIDALESIIIKPPTFLTQQMRASIVSMYEQVVFID